MGGPGSSRWLPTRDKKGDYACVYCGQTCKSVGVLTAHERDCPKRAIKEREWKWEKRKHSARMGGYSRWRKDGD